MTAVRCTLLLLAHILLSSAFTTPAATHTPHRHSKYIKSSMKPIKYEEMAQPSIKHLCIISLQACEILTPLIKTIYNDLDTDKSIVKNKSDNSAFTIADGLVQRLLYVLFLSSSFRGIVGEEDDDHTKNKDEERLDEVNGLSIPNHIIFLVHSTKSEIEKLSIALSNLNGDYSNTTIFIDPIDGTREFSSGKGEQCSICIGFSDENGKAVGGVVYRPLTEKPTWAAGCHAEGYRDCNFGDNSASDDGGLLTSNGSISPFVEGLMEELGMERIKAGGAGNKMLMLLQRSLELADRGHDDIIAKNSMLYIQDRGVSRWDTCAAEAVLEAFGGGILKLTHVHGGDLNNNLDERGRYRYLASETNLDFIPGSACLTKYNCVGSKTITPGETAEEVGQVKPYSNLCGLVAFGKEWKNSEGLKHIAEAVQRAAQNNAPSYD